jgi:hypothetical protein
MKFSEPYGKAQDFQTHSNKNSMVLAQKEKKNRIG